MKKYTILALTLALCGALLVGCGCTNTDVKDTSAPTSRPTTAPTTMPTTAPTTMPSTAPTSETGAGENGAGGGSMGNGENGAGEGSMGNGEGSGSMVNGETAGDNGVVGEDGTGATDMPGTRGRRVRPMG